MYRMNIKQNVEKVLKRRGYTNLTDEENDDETIGFVISFLNKAKKGQVLYCIKDKLQIEDLSNIFAPRIDNNVQIIVIYRDITNPCLKSFNDNISNFLKSSELINEQFFVQDILSHPLIPEYKKLENNEKAEIIKLYKSDENKFPHLKINDPVSIIMGFKVGMMIKVAMYYNFTKKCIDKELPPMITYCVVVK